MTWLEITKVLRDCRDIISIEHGACTMVHLIDAAVAALEGERPASMHTAHCPDPLVDPSPCQHRELLDECRAEWDEHRRTCGADWPKPQPCSCGLAEWRIRTDAALAQPCAAPDVSAAIAAAVAEEREACAQACVAARARWTLLVYMAREACAQACVAASLDGKPLADSIASDIRARGKAVKP